MSRTYTRSTEPFTPSIISATKKKRPPRITTPQSQWRSMMEAMAPGDWFLVPDRFRSRVTNAAGQYLKGRYTMYKHHKEENTFVFARTK